MFLAISGFERHELHLKDGDALRNHLDGFNGSKVYSETATIKKDDFRTHQTQGGLPWLDQRGRQGN